MKNLMAIAFLAVGFLVTLVGGTSLVDRLSTAEPLQQFRQPPERDAAPSPGAMVQVTKSGASAS
jgi:hypothetical protein